MPHRCGTGTYASGQNGVEILGLNLTLHRPSTGGRRRVACPPSCGAPGGWATTRTPNHDRTGGLVLWAPTSGGPPQSWARASSWQHANHLVRGRPAHALALRSPCAFLTLLGGRLAASLIPEPPVLLFCPGKYTVEDHTPSRCIRSSKCSASRPSWKMRVGCQLMSSVFSTRGAS
jgi:hypothetical protein